MVKEALEWLNRAEQAREVAGQLTDPGARKAVLERAESFDRLARAAATPAVLWRRELARKDRERNWCDFSHAFLSRAARYLWRSKTMGQQRGILTPEERAST
jgi:hypothetical protein